MHSLLQMLKINMIGKIIIIYSLVDGDSVHYVLNKCIQFLLTFTLLTAHVYW